MNIMELKEKPIQQLNQIAKDLSVEGHAGLKRQQLIFEILELDDHRSWNRVLWKSRL